jgi:hypothetical protein
MTIANKQAAILQAKTGIYRAAAVTYVGKKDRLWDLALFILPHVNFLPSALTLAGGNVELVVTPRE